MKQKINTLNKPQNKKINPYSKKNTERIEKRKEDYVNFE